MPNLPSLLRHFWPWPPDGLGDSLDRASQALGERLSSASEELACNLNDAAHSLGWGEACTDEEATDWPQPTGGEEGWSGEGWSGPGAQAGGGSGGFDGPKAAPPRYEIPVGGLLQGGAALLLVGLLVGAGGGLLSEDAAAGRPSAAQSDAAIAAQPAHLNGVRPEQLLQAQIAGEPPQEGDRSGAAIGTNPIAQPPAGRSCADREGWYLLPPTPTPTPLPRPLDCQVGRMLREPPVVRSFTWQPRHPTLNSQQPAWRKGEQSSVEFAISAQGGRLYEGVGNGQGCQLEARNDPLIRIELDWVLLPPSAAWIEGTLAQRYTEAYSRAREQGIRCVVVWEGYSQQVETGYADWQPQDPGIYGVRVHLYTAGDGPHPGDYALRATPVPVYLRDSGLGE